jgi:Na+-transporting NADH:ubiquinone oxidoreductase subunit F
MNEILFAILVLGGLAGGLAILLLVAEHFFANYGPCTIDINGGDREVTVQGGVNLLSALMENKIFLPSACGGRGSCGFCKCRVLEGAGPVLPTETGYLSEEEMANDVRLSCQVKVKQDLRVAIPEEILAVREFPCTVERITELTHDIRGLRFRLPEGERIRFKAGQYMQLMAPPYGEVKDRTFRAYSIASPPSEEEAVELVIRLVPDGIVTTWVFEHLAEGMQATLNGPYGEFFLRESEREIIFIAGGSGLAPIRSIVLDMIDRGITHRRARFFFGAVGPRDLYYVEEFESLARAHDWFEFIPALSGAEEEHSYERGLITDVVDRHYGDLDDHEAYLCGSPGMIDACVRVLTAHGLPEELVFYDKFS